MHLEQKENQFKVLISVQQKCWIDIFRYGNPFILLVPSGIENQSKKEL